MSCGEACDSQQQQPHQPQLQQHRLMTSASGAAMAASGAGMRPHAGVAVCVGSAAGGGGGGSKDPLMPDASTLVAAHMNALETGPGPSMSMDALRAILMVRAWCCCRCGCVGCGWVRCGRGWVRGCAGVQGG